MVDGQYFVSTARNATSLVAKDGLVEISAGGFAMRHKPVEAFAAPRGGIAGLQPAAPPTIGVEVRNADACVCAGGSMFLRPEGDLLARKRPRRDYWFLSKLRFGVSKSELLAPCGPSASDSNSVVSGRSFSGGNSYS